MPPEGKLVVGHMFIFQLAGFCRTPEVFICCSRWFKAYGSGVDEAVTAFGCTAVFFVFVLLPRPVPVAFYGKMIHK